MRKKGVLLFLLACFLAGCTAAGTAEAVHSPVAPTDTPALPQEHQGGVSAVEEPTASPTPTPASMPAGRIVFYSERDGDGEIYTMNPDGSDQQRLTDNDADDVAPVWSPDGTRIAFTSDRDDPQPRACFPDCNHNLYVMNADGSDQTRLTDLPGSEGHISWSPDGQWLVFAAYEGGFETAGIYLVAATGGEPQPLLVDEYFNEAPDWSPDGSQIAFSSDREGGLDLFVMNADGSDIRKVVDTGLDDYFPEWSPDGGQIAFFVADFPSVKQDIYLVNADGSEPVNLTNTPGIVDEDPAWSPDGSQIVFQSDRDRNFEIYVMNADGSGARNLSQDRGPDYWPDWVAPPATHIAFVSDRDGRPQIYLMNTDGSDPQRLLASEYDDYFPAWSPDGTQLAFYRHFSWQSWAIMAVDADGGGLRQLTDETNGLTCSFGPVWSPDGAQIAFSVEPDPQPTCEIKHTEIAVMDADGGNVRFLTEDDSNELVAGWSPDMARIYFTSDRDGRGYQVYVMDADGGNPQRLTDLASVNSMPSISPDGRRIAFVSDRDGNDEVYVMNADGSNPTRLTDNPASDWQPSWSPDGAQIIFTSGSLNGGFDLFVMNADGTGLRRLAEAPGWDFEPAWQPLP